MHPTHDENDSTSILASCKMRNADLAAERDALQAQLDAAGPAFTVEAANAILGHVEMATNLCQSLHGLLHAAGHMDLARVAWATFLNTSKAAELMGDALGVEVGCE